MWHEKVLDVRPLHNLKTFNACVMRNNYKALRCLCHSRNRFINSKGLKLIDVA